MCVYAHALHATEEVLYNKASFFPNDNFLSSALFNAEFSDRMTFYYGKVDDSDSRAMGDLLSCRNRMLEARLD